MPAPEPILFFYDYVDPASFLVERRLADLGREIERIPFEVKVPPAAMVDPRAPEWKRYWEGGRAAAADEGIALAQPRLVPWTRKAHELAFHARDQGVFDAVHRALFEAFMLEGKDLGRVDVLLEIATRHGLDLTGTKAVLDVAKHTAAVEEARERAERLRVEGVPTLRSGSAVLLGFQSGDAVRSFLQRA
jgi:predicted DsbA family dithiol-disulfide isomerase